MSRAIDALAAVAAGADAIGMVLGAETARRVTIDVAEKIVAAVPPFVTPVGLFVDRPADEILRVSKRLRLCLVQLHGDEQPELLAQLDGLIVVKAIRADPAALPTSLEHWRRAYRDLPQGRLGAILLETAATAGSGGTGIENDWSLLETAARDGWFTDLPPIIVAGGLTPENVGDVVRRLRPWAVDVSSGIEETRGIKSAGKMQAFAAAVAAIDRTGP